MTSRTFTPPAVTPPPVIQPDVWYEIEEVLGLLRVTRRVLRQLPIYHKRMTRTRALYQGRDLLDYLNRDRPAPTPARLRVS